MSRRPSRQSLSSSQFRRTTKAENRRLGYSDGAKRYVPVGAPVTKSHTISNRTYSNLVRRERLGEMISKETYTQQIKSGVRRYEDEATRLRQVNVAHSRTIRTFVPQITPKDKHLALKWYKDGYKSFSPEEQKQFRAMYSRYVADNVRQAFGSEARDMGAFQMVG